MVHWSLNFLQVCGERCLKLVSLFPSPFLSLHPIQPFLFTIPILYTPSNPFSFSHFLPSTHHTAMFPSLHSTSHFISPYYLPLDTHPYLPRSICIPLARLPFPVHTSSRPAFLSSYPLSLHHIYIPLISTLLPHCTCVFPSSHLPLSHGTCLNNSPRLPCLSPPSLPPSAHCTCLAFPSPHLRPELLVQHC